MPRRRALGLLEFRLGVDRHVLLAAPLVLLILAAVIGSRTAPRRRFELLGGAIGAIVVLFAVAVFAMGDLA